MEKTSAEDECVDSGAETGGWVMKTSYWDMTGADYSYLYIIYISLCYSQSWRRADPGILSEACVVVW